MKSPLCIAVLCVGIAPVFPAEIPAAKFRAVEIDAKIQIGYGVAVADVDGDQRPDIVLADKNQIVWYQNPAWRKHVMVENLTQLDHVCIAAKDIDGDGKAEVAAGAGWNPGDTVGSGAVFYLVPPSDRQQRWEPIKLEHEPTVHRMRWVKNWQGAYDLVVVPLHGRGNKNGAGAGVRVLAYRVPDDVKQPWTTRVLSEEFHMTHNFDPVQWDDDQAQELLLASREGVFVINWVDGKMTPSQLSGTERGGAGEVRLGHLAAGKRFFAAVEPMHGNNLVIYTPPANSDGRWQGEVIDSALKEGHALACGDLLGLGRDQVVIGWRGKNADGKVGIRLYTPVDGEGKEWRGTTVDDNQMACEDLRLADLNGDGKLDIVAAGRATKNVKVYFNETANP